MARHMMVDELLPNCPTCTSAETGACTTTVVSFMNSATGRGYVHVCFEELKVPHVKENLLQEQLLGHIKNGVDVARDAFCG